LHGGRILDAQTGAAKSVGKERQVSSRSDATKTNFMQPEINQEVFAAFARSYSGTPDKMPRFANHVAVMIVTPGFYRHLSKNFRRKTMMARSARRNLV
jgi:hypothetical protein